MRLSFIRLPFIRLLLIAIEGIFTLLVEGYRAIGLILTILQKYFREYVDKTKTGSKLA